MEEKKRSKNNGSREMEIATLQAQEKNENVVDLSLISTNLPIT